MEEFLLIALYVAPLAVIVLSVDVYRKAKRIRRLESRIEKLHLAEKERLSRQFEQTETMAEVVRLLKIQTKCLKAMTPAEKTFS